MYAGRARCFTLLLLLLLHLMSGKNDVEGCTSGFINLESLIGQSATLGLPLTGQNLYPSINFTCSGSITGWTVLTFLSSGNDDTLYPDLQVWRAEGSGAYTRVGNTTLSEGIIQPGGSSGYFIRQYPLETPLEFQTGDIFGIFQPPLIRNLQLSTYRRLGSTPTFIHIGTNNAVEPPNSTLNLNDVNSSDSTFAHVHISVSSDQPQCVTGFVTNETLQSVFLIRRDGGRMLIPDSTQTVSPRTSFTCDGNVTKWIIRWQESSSSSLSFPEIQVWRFSNEANATFQLVGNTAITAELGATRAIADRVFEFTVDPPLPVQAGDVLGIYRPESRIRLYYGAEESNEVLYQTVASSLTVFPDPTPTVSTISRVLLISVEVVAKSRSLTTTTSVISMTTTMFPRPTDDSTSFPVAAVAAGVGGGALVALAVLIVLIIVAVVACRKRKRKTMSSNGSTYVHDNKDPESDRGERHFSNPVYGVVNDISLHEIALDNEVVGTAEYAEIDRSHRDQSRSSPTYHTLEERVIEQHSQYQSISDPVYGSSEDDWDTLVGAHPSTDLMLVPTALQRQGSHAHHPAEEAVIYSRVLKEVHQTPLKLFEEEEIYWEPALDSSQLYSQLARHKYREIPRSQIRLTSNLGSGQFGTVDRGMWYTHSGCTDVAVKTMKEGSCEDDQVKFLQEAAIMGQFSHPNVVKLYGVVTVGEPVMIVEEFLSKGDLREHLHSLSPVRQQDRRPYHNLATSCLRFCGEIASGMKYLTAKAFVHRDLAARNVLVSRDTVCKIGDFGMTRDIEDLDYYKSSGGKVPVKWTAPEALTMKKYSTASDVWSFGAVMYEIWSLGHKPFESYTNPEAFHKVSEGARLPPPPGCPRTVYQLMINCWHPEPQSRPSFSDVTTFLSQPESALLMWSEEDRAVHPNAATLGAELQEGYTLYTDLQNTYVQTK